MNPRIALLLLLLWPVPARAQRPPATRAVRDVPTTQLSPVPAIPNLPHYDKVPTPLKGTLTAVGSSLTISLIAGWSDDFAQLYPDVDVHIQVAGSAAAPPALADKKNPATLGAMNRAMTDAERAAFRDSYGYDPTPIQVAVSGVAFFVSVDNPCPRLSLRQLDSMFSHDRKRGGPPVTRWGDVGLTGDWADAPVILYGLTSPHGEYALVRDVVLLGGDYHYFITDDLTPSFVVQDVAVDRGAIGYANVASRTRRTRPLPLASDDAGPYYPPDYDNCLSGKYPLATPLYIYINKPPGKPLDPVVREFLRFACCHTAQQAAARAGVYPLTPALTRRQLDLLDH